MAQRPGSPALNLSGSQQSSRKMQLLLPGGTDGYYTAQHPRRQWVGEGMAPVAMVQAWFV